MKNFICGSDYEGATYNKLCIKIFTGKSKEVESKVQDFINSHPIEIETVKQSESMSDEDFNITLTIFYYSEGKPQFIDERWSIEMLTRKIGKELEDSCGITLAEIQDVVWAKRDKLLQGENKNVK